MRRHFQHLCFFITVAILLHSATFFCHANNSLSLSAESAILIDSDSGAVLYEKNPRERMGMASTTKIMTALTVTRLTSIDKTVTIPREAVGIEGSSVYLCAGEKLTVEQLLYALLLSSANDAAVALAIYCSGSVEAFSDEMNAHARELGLVDTNFVNPHGLDDDAHYTTAYDLAIISREAMQNSELRRIFSTYKMPLPFDGVENKRLAVNHNKLLCSYDGAIGIKTGFTKATGRCLVSAAQRDGLTLIAVTLNAPDDWRDHTSLLDYGFDNFERRTIVGTGELAFEMPTVGGELESAVLVNTSPLVLTLPKGAPTPKITVCSPHRFLYAPTQKGTAVATACIVYKAQSCESVMIVSETVALKKINKGFWRRLADIFKKD